jgi:unsaturated rhamnogalacturonyl hydrolase
MVDALSASRVLAAAAERAMTYPYKVWGFGEDVCLRALVELARATGDEGPAAFVAGLVRPWCEAKAGQAAVTNADHVAPGMVILELFEGTRDDIYLQTALKLGDLHRGFPVVSGVRVHRPDLDGLNDLIWVDCIALDGPFLARLANVTGEQAWRDLAVETTLAYADALLDRGNRLFRHGFNTKERVQSDCCWARGNGWAMHGLLDTIVELPLEHPGRQDLIALLEQQVQAVVRLQDASGHWHTVLDDPTSPLESSAAAFYASAALKARRLGLLRSVGGLEAMVEAAVGAVLDVVLPERGGVELGALPVSYATPVGRRDTYVNAPTGFFPWGQGPLMLTLLEATAAAQGRP